jgi:hypothetical protein
VYAFESPPSPLKRDGTKYTTGHFFNNAGVKMTERNSTALELLMEINPKKQIADLLPRVNLFTICEVSSDDDMMALGETLKYLSLKQDRCYIIPMLEADSSVALELAMELNCKEQIAGLLPHVTVFTVCEVSSDDDMMAFYGVLKYLPYKAHGRYIIPIFELE